jgi:hypothetical protein
MGAQAHRANHQAHVSEETVRFVYRTINQGKQTIGRLHIAFVNTLQD